MGLIERILDRVGYKKKSSTTWGDLWITAKEWKLFQDQVNQPYKQISNIYKPIKAIADNVSQAELIFKDWDTEKEVYPEDIINLFDNPNPLMSGDDFKQAIAGYMALYGEVFIVKVSSIGSQIGTKRLPAELWTFNPANFQEVIEDGKLVRWRYKGKQIFDKDEVIHIRDFNPYHNWRGLRPIDPLVKIMDIDWLSLIYNKAFFKNDGTPGYVLTTEQTLSETQRERLRKWWEKRHKGASEAFKVAVLEAGLKPASTSLSHKDMDFIEQKRYTREEMLGVFRVPKALFNITEDLNYACIVEGERIYTTNGSIKVEEVRSGDKVFTFSNNGVSIKSVVNSWKQGEKESYEIKTNWRALKVSYDHPILCLERDFVEFNKYPYYKGVGRLVYKKAEDIERGDLIVVANECRQNVDTGYNADFAEFVGAFIGDGCFQGRGKNGRYKSVMLSIPEWQKKLRKRYIEIASKEFNYKIKRGNVKVSAANKYSISFFGNTVDRLLEAGCVQGSKNKRIPTWVFKAKRDIQLAFLRGYIDTDGSLQKRGNVVIASPNKDLVYDLVSLCDYCGLRHTNVAEENRITNYGESTVYRFSITYPAEIACLKNSDRLISTKKDKGYYRKTLTTALDVLPPGFHIEKVKSKTFIGTRTVYDLEIEDRHNFLCNGVVVHNTFMGQMRIFWIYTLAPILRKLADGFNRGIVYPYNSKIYCEFDYKNVPAFQEDFERKIDIANKLFMMGIPMREINEKLELGFKPEVLPDTGYLPFNLVPTGEQKQEQEPKGIKKDIEKAEDNAWKVFLNKHIYIEGKFASVIKRFFFEQRKRILDNINRKDAAPIQLTINWEKENDELIKYVMPYLYSGIKEGVSLGESILGRLEGIDNEILEQKIKSYLALRGKKITKINETIRTQIMVEIDKGTQQGESIQQISDRIRGIYNMAANRSRTIARTETTGALNGGSLLYYEEAGAKYKKWSTAGDEAVRPSHMMIHGEIVKNEARFSNGLDFPGGEGPPEEVINCRCIILPVIKKEE